VTVRVGAVLTLRSAWRRCARAGVPTKGSYEEKKNDAWVPPVLRLLKNTLAPERPREQSQRYCSSLSDKNRAGLPAKTIRIYTSCDPSGLAKDGGTGTGSTNPFWGILKQNAVRGVSSAIRGSGCAWGKAVRLV